jgi:uncharacterized protein
MERVHVAVTRRVKPGRDMEFEEALRKFARDSLAEPGTTGVLLIGPAPGGANGEYGILRSFESEAASESFYESDLFGDWQRRVAPLVEGEPIRRKLAGLEAFFRHAGPPPPRWKMALVTWLGVFPTVLLWSSLLGNVFLGLPRLLAAALLNGLVVATLTWLVMPALTKALAGWLRKG